MLRYEDRLAAVVDAREAANEAGWAADIANYAASEAEAAKFLAAAGEAYDAATQACSARDTAAKQADLLNSQSGGYVDCRRAATEARVSCRKALQAALDARTMAGLVQMGGWPTRWNAAGATQVGSDHKRHAKPNEDAYVVTDDGLIVVADGMGGNAGGNIASSSVTASFQALWAYRNRFASPEQWERNAIAAAAWQMRVAEQGNAALKGMATTLLAGTRVGPRFDVTHLGDSRMYLLRQQTLVRLTCDHTGMEDAFEELTEEQMLENEANLTRSLGAANDIAESRVSLELFPGDVVLFCTDGMHTVSTRQLRDLLMRRDTPRVTCEELIRLAVAQGSHDDVTVVVMQY